MNEIATFVKKVSRSGTSRRPILLLYIPKPITELIDLKHGDSVKVTISKTNNKTLDKERPDYEKLKHDQKRLGVPSSHEVFGKND